MCGQGAALIAGPRRVMRPEGGRAMQREHSNSNQFEDLAHMVLGRLADLAAVGIFVAALLTAFPPA